jgi:hypothetical protein
MGGFAVWCHNLRNPAFSLAIRVNECYRDLSRHEEDAQLRRGFSRNYLIAA